jgi:GDPmannose 4,6-dehydratase
MSKTALITGITGQDGSYLAELLLCKGYTVYGLIRRSSTSNLARLEGVRTRVVLLEGDLLDQSSLDHAVNSSNPDEIYNLAGPSFVASSFKQPVLTGEVGALGGMRLMEASKSFAPKARIFQASSSEMFGGTNIVPQNESTPFHPRTPYGIAKVYAFMAARYYRENYGMFVCNGIMYNHESPRRGVEYVTRKITIGIARIALGLQEYIELGNLDGMRDWGYAPEYMDGAWRMLQQKEPDDFLLATGEVHTVREFLEEACRVAGVENPDKIVRVNPSYLRPADFTNLKGDAEKAVQVLGWKPRVKFNELVRIMVESDLRASEMELGDKKKHQP